MNNTIRHTAFKIQDSGLWFDSFKIQATIIALLAFIFYINTYQNEYALDDQVVIIKNEYVLEGFAGIPDILTKDAFDSYYSQLKTTDHLKGGRYRPLSMVTFAIEQQFFGAIPAEKVDSVMAYGMTYEMNEPYERQFLGQMHVRHLVNVLLYALSVVVLLYFLRYVVFRGQPLAAFIAALLFTIHPIHTEVVANVKSRDEIMSLLFICLTFIFSHRWLANRKQWRWLMAGLVSYFLAFLSKEYAITLIILLPISFYLFGGLSFRRSLLFMLPYVGVAAVYIFIRWQITGPGSDIPINDIQVNPYAFAMATQKIATEIATSLNYLKLLVFPHPLSSDYSYNQIPYKNFSDAIVWVSLIIHAGLAAGMFYFLRKRDVLGFAIAFYLCNLLMVCNVFFDIGATMGERLIYHSSVGFAIAVAYLLCRGMELRKRVGSGERRAEPIAISPLSPFSFPALFLVVITVLCGVATITRNRDWKNNQSLYFRDINAAPNSFLVNINVASLLVNKSDYEKDTTTAKEDLHRAIPIFDKVIAMQDTYILGYMNRGIAYLKLGEADSLVYNLDRVRALYPVYPSLPGMYFRASSIYYSKKDYAKAAEELRVMLQLNPGNPQALNALRIVDSVAGRERGE